MTNGIVLDYTSRIAPDALRAAGVVGVCRYLSLPIASTAWKRIGWAEYRELVTNGFDVTLNWEYDARDWNGQAGLGTAHGAMAVAQAKALDYPAGKVIVGSADFDMTRAEWLSNGMAYGAAYRDAIRKGGYRPGVYGPWDVLEWCKGIGYDAFWQAGMSTAWSNGRNAKPWPGAHFRQRAHLWVGGHDTDYNDILINPLWGVTNMKDVTIYRNSANGACVARGGMVYYAIPDEARLASVQTLIKAAGGDATLRPVDDLGVWDVLITSGVDVAALRNAGAGGGVTVPVTPDDLATAVAANVAALGAAFAGHFKVV